MISKCPKCQSTLTSVNMQAIEISRFRHGSHFGVSCTCPNCYSILSIAVDASLVIRTSSKQFVSDVSEDMVKAYEPPPSEAALQRLLEQALAMLMQNERDTFETAYGNGTAMTVSDPRRPELSVEAERQLQLALRVIGCDEIVEERIRTAAK